MGSPAAHASELFEQSAPQSHAPCNPCAQGATPRATPAPIGCWPLSAPPSGPPSQAGSTCGRRCHEQGQGAPTEEGVEGEPLLIQADFVALLKGCHPQPGSEGPEDSPGLCAACSEPLDDERAGVRTECNHWFHPLCLLDALENARSSSGCSLCGDSAPPHGLGRSLRDEEVVAFVVATKGSVLAAERAHEQELADIKEICAQLPPDVFENPHNSKRLASLSFNKKQDCMEELDATLRRLEALREGAAHAVSVFSRNASNFDLEEGTSIADDFVSRCVLQTSLARDCGEEGSVAFLSGRMKAIQTAIFSTMGFEEEGALISRGQ